MVGEGMCGRWEVYSQLQNAALLATVPTELLRFLKAIVVHIVCFGFYTLNTEAVHCSETSEQTLLRGVEAKKKTAIWTGLFFEVL